MADAEPLPAEAKKKSSFMGMLVEFLLITLLAAGAGAAMTMMSPPPPPADKTAGDKPAPGKLAQEKKEGEKVENAANCAAGGPSLVDLPPIVTNIANPPDTWVRLEGSIVIDPKTMKDAEVVAAEIATDELAYLRTISVNELQGPIGLENIRQDLRDRAMVRSGGKVIDLLLKTLVLQ